MKIILITILFSISFCVTRAQYAKDSLIKMRDSRLGVTYDYTHFEKQFQTSWQIASLEYSHRRNSGTYLARINYGNRYSQSGVNIEVEAYPKISKRFYGYIGIGYSPDFPVFPKFNAGASLFANLPGAFEADAGVRYLNFDNNTWVYTASAGKYAGNFWFNLRTYVAPGDENIAQSNILTTRYYLKSADDYFTLILGSGISPDDRSQAVQLNSKYNLKSHRLAAGYRFSLKNNVVTLQAGICNLEYMPGVKDKQVNGILGYQRKF